jgi:hypothetical protein
MSLIGLAAQAGVTSSAVAELISGKVPVGIAMRLGVTSSSLQDFVNGGTSIGLAASIGCTSSSLQELRDNIGAEGAIGFIIGLCISHPK